MKAEDMIWEFLPKGLKGVFEIVRVERTGAAFHVWMDEIRQKAYEDRKNLQIVGKGYTDYCTRTCPSAVFPRCCICASANGLTRIQVRYSATT